MPRVVAGQPGQVAMRMFAGEDDAVLSGTPTASVVDWLGNAIAGATVWASDAVPGVWMVVLPDEATDAVRRLTVTLTGTIDGGLFDGRQMAVESTVDVVGARCFDLGELRDAPGMAATRWTTAQLDQARDVVEQRAEQFFLTSLVVTPQVWRAKACEMATRDGAHRLAERYVRTVVAVTDDSGIVDVSGAVVAPWGVIRGLSLSGDVTVLGTRGYSDVPPADLRHSLIAWACDVVVQQGDTGNSRRAISLSNDVESYRLATATADYPSGIPDVDATLRSWRDLLRLPGIA